MDGNFLRGWVWLHNSKDERPTRRQTTVRLWSISAIVTNMPNAITGALRCRMYLLTLLNVKNLFEVCPLSTMYLVNIARHSSCTSCLEYAITPFFCKLFLCSKMGPLTRSQKSSSYAIQNGVLSSYFFFLFFCSSF